MGDAGFAAGAAVATGAESDNMGAMKRGLEKKVEKLPPSNEDDEDDEDDEVIFVKAVYNAKKKVKIEDSKPVRKPHNPLLVLCGRKSSDDVPDIAIAPILGALWEVMPDSTKKLYTDVAA